MLVGFLGNEEEANVPEAESGDIHGDRHHGHAHERRKSGCKPFPATMERNEIIINALSDAERACPACGTPRPEIDEERTAELRLIPARTVVDVYVMKK